LSDGLSKPPKSEPIACTRARHEMDVAGSSFAVDALNNLHFFSPLKRTCCAFKNRTCVHSVLFAASQLKPMLKSSRL
jgi:hypothetical protein